MTGNYQMAITSITVERAGMPILTSAQSVARRWVIKKLTLKNKREIFIAGRRCGKSLMAAKSWQDKFSDENQK